MSQTHKTQSLLPTKNRMQALSVYVAYLISLASFALSADKTA